jgi:hypothetical protein
MNFDKDESNSSEAHGFVENYFFFLPFFYALQCGKQSFVPPSTATCARTLVAATAHFFQPSVFQGFLRFRNQVKKKSVINEKDEVVEVLYKKNPFFA